MLERIVGQSSPEVLLPPGIVLVPGVAALSLLTGVALASGPPLACIVWWIALLAGAALWGAWVLRKARADVRQLAEGIQARDEEISALEGRCQHLEARCRDLENSCNELSVRAENAEYLESVNSRAAAETISILWGHLDKAGGQSALDAARRDVNQSAGAVN